MKVRVHSAPILTLATAVLLWLSGCGSSNVNQVADTVSPTSATVVAGTTQVFSSTVTGAATGDLDSTWSCQYVYTPAPTTSQPNPTQKGPFNCTSGQTVNGGSIGTWTTDQTSTDNTLSYTAPQLTNFPNPIPIITFTAAATANKNKKGTATVTMDTGIRVAITPNTAAAPVGVTPAQIIPFTATLASGPPFNINWKVMQPVVGSSSQICTDFPSLSSGGECGTANPNGTSCSPNCGSIDATGVFTAPSTMPTDTSPVSSGTNATTAAPTVTVVAWVSGDIYHYATASITLVNASTNPITFTGIHPTTVAAGGVLQDVWLDARNLLYTTQINFISPSGAVSPISSSNVFTVPITANYCTPSATGVTPVITCDASITTRVRLTAAQLAQAGTAQIQIANIPTTSGQAQNISFPLQIVYASPSLVSSVPYNLTSGVPTTLSADGGYYGIGSSPLVNVDFNGLGSAVSTITPRQFNLPLVGSNIPTPPGLYPLSVSFIGPSSSSGPTAPPYTTDTTNLAVQPTFSALSNCYFSLPTSTQPATQILTPPSIALPAFGGTSAVQPSAMALNSVKGYAVITEQASNSIQLVDLTAQTSSGLCSPRHAPVPVFQLAVGNQPTGVAIDPNAYNGDDFGVVVNSADSTLTLLDLTPTTATNLGTLSLAGLIPGNSTSACGALSSGQPCPAPYSVGIDPTTHYGVVAFSNSNIGFIVNVNPNATAATSPPCFISSQSPPCAIASVSLVTGSTPQVVVQPDTPVAYVTPGGGLGGVTSVVGTLQTNNTVAIAPASSNGATCAANVATILTATANGLNQAFPGVVLVQGVTPTTPVNYNGVYQVLSASNYSFTYLLNGNSCPGSTPTPAGGGSFVFGNPFYTFNTSTTATGAAFNDVTNTFAYADPNVTTGQIGFISGLDQSTSSLTVTLGTCTSSTNPCTPPATGPEPGIRFVSWDPFVNVLIGYDPQTPYNLISLVNPGGPTANGSQGPTRLIQAINTGQQGCLTPANSQTCAAYGPMVYDPKTNLVLVANAGSNTLTYLDIDPTSSFKPINISDVQVTSGGVANSQPPLASAPNAPNPLPKAVCAPSNPTNQYATCFQKSVTVGQPATMNILGQGFGSNPVVRLDGDPTGITVNSATDTQIQISVAASRFTSPHNFALDVLNGSTGSNAERLYAVAVIDVSATCSAADMPEAVAYDDIRHVALVTNNGCNNVSIINMDSTNTFNYGVPYGTVMSTVSVGASPLGIATIPRLGYAVTANNTESSASIINISNPLQPSTLAFTAASCTVTSGTVNTTNICVGVSPSGVAIDQDRALAIIANTGGNSLSAIDLTPLLQSNSADCPSSTCVPVMQLVATSGPPTAIAVDSNRSEAVVTNVQNAGTTSVVGGLDVIALNTNPPARSSTASISTLTANPTGIVVDPAIPSSGCGSSNPSACTTLSPALFYVSSTQQNAVYSFNPDSSSTAQIPVGVNPYSLGYNFQTGTLLSINSTSNTSSLIDTVNSGNSVFAKRASLGISSQSQFAVAVDNFTNTAIIADQNNNRVLIMALN